uniref:Uncharacterized protein n=1 Tax=Cacopsylla melanoneura TaxID=428564 RepID=A0A8D8ZD56_9HEMI
MGHNVIVIHILLGRVINIFFISVLLFAFNSIFKSSRPVLTIERIFSTHLAMSILVHFFYCVICYHYQCKVCASFELQVDEFVVLKPVLNMNLNQSGILFTECVTNARRKAS